MHPTSGNYFTADEQGQVSKSTGHIRRKLYSPCDEQRQVSLSPAPINRYSIPYGNEEDQYSPPSSFQPVMKNVSFK